MRDKRHRATRRATSAGANEAWRRCQPVLLCLPFSTLPEVVSHCESIVLRVGVHALHVRFRTTAAGNEWLPERTVAGTTDDGNRASTDRNLGDCLRAA